MILVQRTWRVSVLLCAGLLAACAQPGPPPQQQPNVNLAGFPPAFRKGYVDGCNSAHGSLVRDKDLFAGDMQYASGWRDGHDICAKK